MWALGGLAVALMMVLAAGGALLLLAMPVRTPDESEIYARILAERQATFHQYVEQFPDARPAELMEAWMNLEGGADDNQ